MRREYLNNCFLKNKINDFDKKHLFEYYKKNLFLLDSGLKYLPSLNYKINSFNDMKNYKIQKGFYLDNKLLNAPFFEEQKVKKFIFEKEKEIKEIAYELTFKKYFLEMNYYDKTFPLSGYSYERLPIKFFDEYWKYINKIDIEWNKHNIKQ
jgi:hypothetical protein